jgi:TolA-binding protein
MSFEERQGESECRGDLVARERRGELSGNDCLALQAHLAECASCRVSRQIYVDFDDVSGIDVYDGARIERMSSAARRWAHHRGRGARPGQASLDRRRRLRGLGLMVAALLVCGTAGATVWLWRHPRPYALRAPQASAPAPSRPPAPAATPAGSAAATPAASAVASSSAATSGRLEAPRRAALAGVSGHRVAHAPARQLAQLGQDVPASSAARRAAELLRQASDARRAGDVERALALYRSLQRDFPSSQEALVSSVAIGGLLLAGGTPRAALGEFEAYLGSSRGGELIPEALYGRGRALAALRDRSEERRTWQRLLADFPDSAYGPWARRRLADLE